MRASLSVLAAAGVVTGPRSAASAGGPLVAGAGVGAASASMVAGALCSARALFDKAMPRTSGVSQASDKNRDDMTVPLARPPAAGKICGMIPA